MGKDLSLSCHSDPRFRTCLNGDHKIFIGFTRVQEARGDRFLAGWSRDSPTCPHTLSTCASCNTMRIKMLLIDESFLLLSVALRMVNASRLPGNIRVDGCLSGLENSMGCSGNTTLTFVGSGRLTRNLSSLFPAQSPICNSAAICVGPGHRAFLNPDLVNPPNLDPRAPHRP